MKPSLNTFAEMILEACPQYRKWDRDVFWSWLNWHCFNGFVLCALTDSGDVAGLALVRTVMKPKDASDYYEYDPEGSCYFVDVLICKQKYAMQAIGFAVLQRFGQRDRIAWQRPPFHVTEVHDAKRLRHHLFGKAMVKL